MKMKYYEKRGKNVLEKSYYVAVSERTIINDPRHTRKPYFKLIFFLFIFTFIQLLVLRED